MTDEPIADTPTEIEIEIRGDGERLISAVRYVRADLYEQLQRDLAEARKAELKLHAMALDPGHIHEYLQEWIDEGGRDER